MERRQLGRTEPRGRAMWHSIPAAGAAGLLLSMCSIVLSLGAPGLGWGLATVTMVALSLCCRLVGPGWVSVCLAVTTMHALTLGPLGGGPGASFGSDWLVGTVFTSIPFLAGAVALVATCLRSRT
jgi:hypothetical protein